MRFGKGRERSFRELMTAKTRYFPRQIAGKTALARSSTKAQAWGRETQEKCHGSPWRRAKAPMPRFRGPVLTHHPGMTVDGLLRRFAPRNDDGRNNNKCGGTHDGYVRFCRGGRWLRRLRGREPSLRGSRDVGGAAGSRRRVQQLGRNLTGRDDPDDLGQGQQLGVRYRAASGPQWPDRLSAARQGARRLLRDQRDGLYPRPPQRLRSVGGARQHRLVLRRRAALLQALGGQFRTRRR